MNTNNHDILRATGLLIIEVVSSNPNGDPDRESDPRQRPNGIGEISPVSFKRKLRDLLEDREGPVFREILNRLPLAPDRLNILESRGRDRGKVSKELAKDIKSFDQKEFLESEFVKKYWDARLFGNTFLEEGGNKGYIKTGIAQFGMGLSLAPINIVRHTNTNKAGVELGKDQGMAPLAYRVVEHAVYCMPFFINPSHARKSGCTKEDIEVLKALIPYAYDHTRSAIRPDVRLRHAWYIEHKNTLGSCPDHLLFEALTPAIKNPESPTAPAGWSDYDCPKTLPDSLKDRISSCVDLCNPDASA